MAQILVRNLDNNVVARLKKRAQKEGRSLQSEVRVILEQAAQADMEHALELANAVRGKFMGRKFQDSTELIREDRDQ